MTRAFITGITGQTGSYLCEQLLAEGWQVHGLVSSPDGLESALTERAPSVALHRGDLANPDELRRIVVEVAPDVVFNLGGISSVAQSWQQPHRTGEVTGLSVATLLAAVKTLGESGHETRFVQASSAEIFGAAPPPQNESTPVRPLNPYGAAKAYAHHLVGLYRQSGVAASTAILFNHESPRRPEAFVTRKITMGAARIATGEADHLSLGNLDARRDWGWAPDYADAIRRIALGEPDDFIVATGVAHTVEEFVAAAFRAAGIEDWRPYIRVDERFLRATDPASLVGDPSHIRDTLGWQPTVGFEELVARMVESDLAALRGEFDPLA